MARSCVRAGPCVRGAATDGRTDRPRLRHARGRRAAGAAAGASPRIAWLSRRPEAPGGRVARSDGRPGDRTAHRGGPWESAGPPGAAARIAADAAGRWVRVAGRTARL